MTSNSSTLLFTEDNIETFKDCWDWEVLSDKSCIDMTHELLIKYADRWNWAYIIDRYGDDSITYNEEFLESMEIIFLHQNWAVLSCGTILSNTA